jgi:hypothetical protein
VAPTSMVEGEMVRSATLVMRFHPWHISPMVVGVEDRCGNHWRQFIIVGLVWCYHLVDWKQNSMLMHIVFMSGVGFRRLGRSSMGYVVF